MHILRHAGKATCRVPPVTSTLGGTTLNSMASATSVPEKSFLAVYADKGAYTDCYAMSVPGTVALADFIYAFYTMPLFKVERWLLAKALGFKATDQEARLLAMAEVARYSAWRVERRSETEILMDAGQTRSWLSVRPQNEAGNPTTLLFGSAVVPMRPNGKFGPAFHALLGFHQLYSNLLLRSASKRIVGLRNTQSAA